MYNEILRQEEVKVAYSGNLSPNRNAMGQQTEFRFNVSHLGSAILKSGLSPEEGLLVYLDLIKANQGIILSNELH